MDIIREAPLGQIIRYLTKNRVFQYPEERADFVLPPEYQNLDTLKVEDSTANTPSNKSLAESVDGKNVAPNATQEQHEEPLAPPEPEQDPEKDGHDLEKATTRRSEIGESIRPVKTKDGVIVISWYSTTDPANPQNWPLKAKILTSLVIYVYTFCIYCGSSQYSPAVFGVMDEFGATTTVALLGLAMYVLAYGTFSLVWSPLSEIPSVGRNPVYLATMAIFVCMSVGAPLSPNLTALILFRFFQGGFGAPCLATGGASLADLYDYFNLTYGIVGWAISATAGPSFGPIIAGYAIEAKGWRWGLWEILWLAGPIFLVMFCFLPETYAPNILLRKAQRLRKLTGNQQLRAQSEIDQANMKPRQIVFDALVRPFLIVIQDPSIAFATMYIALIYGIYYSYFPAFDIVFTGTYGFSLGSTGLAFLSIAVAVVVGAAIYCGYVYYILNPRMAREGPGDLERRLVPGLFASPLIPIGMFLFAWTARESIHWIVPLIGVFLFTVGVFILIQSLFSWLPMVFPKYVASVFSSNNAARSSLAFAAVLFATPMYTALGIGGGVSLLAAFMVVGCGGIFILWKFGKQLRARSKFAG